MFCYYVKFFFPVLRPILDVHNAVHDPALILERGAPRVDLVQDALQIAGIDFVELMGDADEAIAALGENPLTLEDLDEIIGYLDNQGNFQKNIL